MSRCSLGGGENFILTLVQEHRGPVGLYTKYTHAVSVMSRHTTYVSCTVRVFNRVKILSYNCITLLMTHTVCTATALSMVRRTSAMGFEGV